jgi:two-component system invasion response regulator UvrY
MRNLKLLIVDDHKAAREALVERLSNETGILVRDVPASAPEALSEAMDDVPDVVLLDIKTCLGDGLQLFREMVNEHPKVKVMVLTSCASPQELSELKKMGVSDFLFKDLDVTALLAAIHTEN